MKKFKFEIKEMQEDGSFTGIASMYGNKDLGGDIVEKGAFTKTLQENNSVPLLWQHEQKMPIGLGTLEDIDKGLMIKGQLNLEVEKGKEAYSLIKQGAIKGLSIGYDVVKQKFDKSVRLLKELKLWEVSVVTFPMNMEATISSVKSEDIDSEEKGLDLQTTLIEEESRTKLWKLKDLLDSTIRAIMNKNDLDNDAKLKLIDNTLAQFHTLYMASITFNITNGIKMQIGGEYTQLKKEKLEKMLNTILQEEEEDVEDESVKDNSKSIEKPTDEVKIEELKQMNTIFEEMKTYINREEK